MQSDQDPVEVTLALDVGGTFIKSAVFRGGELLQELPQQPSCSDGTVDEALGALRCAITAAGNCDRIGIAIPGPFDYTDGISRMTHKFMALNGLNLRRELADGRPMAFVHDCNAFLLGELAAGELAGCRRAGAVTLGTGLGASFAEDGVPLNNELGSPASEVSLWNKPWKKGVVEDSVSSRALLARYPAAANVKEIADRAKAGDPAALAVWREFGEDLGAVLRGWVKKFAMEKVVFGGQISKDFRLFGGSFADLPVAVSKLSNAALYGAASAARFAK